MRKKIEWFWETLDANTCRAKVIGGWIVRSEYVLPKERLCCTSSVFIMDKDHEWYIKQPVVEEAKPKDDISSTF